MVERRSGNGASRGSGRNEGGARRKDARKGRCDGPLAGGPATSGEASTPRTYTEDELRAAVAEARLDGERRILERAAAAYAEGIERGLCLSGAPGAGEPGERDGRLVGDAIRAAFAGVATVERGRTDALGDFFFPFVERYAERLFGPAGGRGHELGDDDDGDL